MNIYCQSLLTIRRKRGLLTMKKYFLNIIIMAMLVLSACGTEKKPDNLTSEYDWNN